MSQEILSRGRPQQIFYEQVQGFFTRMIEPWQEAWAGREGQAKSRDGSLASSGRPAAGSRASQQWRTHIADCLHDPHTFSADYTPANVFPQPASTLESLQRNAHPLLPTAQRRASHPRELLRCLHELRRLFLALGDSGSSGDCWKRQEEEARNLLQTECSSGEGEEAEDRGKARRLY